MTNRTFRATKNDQIIEKLNELELAANSYYEDPRVDQRDSQQGFIEYILQKRHTNE